MLTSGTARLLAPLTAHEAPAVVSPHPDDAPWLQQTALQLLDEHRALGRRPLDVHHALRRSLLESLLLRLANAPGIPPAGTAKAGRGDTYGSWTPWSCGSANCTGPRMRLLLEARRLLGAARWDARTVALHLGFTDPANFGRFFRSHTGLTPSAFAARATTTDA